MPRKAVETNKGGQPANSKFGTNGGNGGYSKRATLTDTPNPQKSRANYNSAGQKVTLRK